MRRSLFAAALIALAAPAAIAQTGPAAVTAAPDPARLAAARELMEAMRISDMMDAMLRPMMDNMVKQMVDAVTSASPEMAAERARDPHFDERMRRTSRVVGTEMQAFMREYMPTMMEGYAKAYAQVFTMAELRAQIAFYRSPVGQAVARKTPELTVRASGDVMGSMMPALMARMQGMEAKMKAALADLPPPPAKPAA